jgi:hypothetical protein
VARIVIAFDTLPPNKKRAAIAGRPELLRQGLRSRFYLLVLLKM